MKNRVVDDMEQRFKEQLRSEGGIQEAIQEANKPLEIEMQPEHEPLMMANPLDSPNYLAIDQLETPESPNVSLRLADNEKAREILQSNRFELADKKLDVLDSMQSDLFFSKDAGFKQISLGNVGVLSKDTIALEDVDLANIPKSQDISLNPELREVVIIGKEMTPEETAEREAGAAPPGTEVLDGQVFVEKSLEDARREEMNLVERLMTESNLFELLLLYLKIFPVILLLIFYYNAFWEQETVRKEILEVDEQNMKALKQLKQSVGALKNSATLKKY